MHIKPLSPRHFSWPMLLMLLGCAHHQGIRPIRRDIVDVVFGSGHIENKQQYSVMSNAEGYIKIALVAEGDSVKRGQELFRLSNEIQQTQVGNALVNLKYARSNSSPRAPQIEQLKIQIRQAEEKNRIDSANFERYARLVKTKAVSTQDFENARLNASASLSSLHVLEKNLADLRKTVDLNVQNARSQYRIQQENNTYYVLKADAPGIIMNIGRKAGDYVKKGDVIGLVGAGSPLIKIDIAEDDISRIQLGQTVLISLNSMKRHIFKAKITKIYPAFNTSEQSFIVEAEFLLKPDLLLNGTQLQANILIGENKNALVIPSYYLLNENQVQTKDRKERKTVEVGIRTLEWTEIKSGLSENDELVLPDKP